MSSLERQLDVAVQQYNAVVKQNKDLQKELNAYKKALEEVLPYAERLKNNNDYKSLEEVENDINKIILTVNGALK
jgi:hypothetical protein